MAQRIILIGFMASGKSAVAAELAKRIGWRFVDFDVEIEKRTGLNVGELVARRGERYLRRLEAVLTKEHARATGVVIAPGGGWITRPDLLGELRRDALVVWLRVRPEDVVRRLRQRAGRHPFASGFASVDSVQELLDRREPLYRLADVEIDTTGWIPDEIAAQIQSLANLPARPAGARRSRPAIRPPGAAGSATEVDRYRGSTR
jgi:shikimate kinase